MSNLFNPNNPFQLELLKNNLNANNFGYPTLGVPTLDSSNINYSLTPVDLGSVLQGTVPTFNPMSAEYVPINPVSTASNNGIFGSFQNAPWKWTPQNVMGVAQAGVGVLSGLLGAYQSYKQTKEASRALQEQNRLNRANFRNTAKAYNSNLRNHISGSGLSVMDSESLAKLGNAYRSQRVQEDY